MISFNQSQGPLPCRRPSASAMVGHLLAAAKSLGILCLVLAAGALASCKLAPPPARAFPAERAKLHETASVPIAKAREIEFLGDTAIVSQNFDGMSLVDVANPEKPRLRRHFGPELVQPLFIKAIEPGLLVVADRFRGLVLLDLTSLDAPTSLSQLALPGIATHLDLFARSSRVYAAVACGAAGVAFVDITQPRSPKLISRFQSDIDYSRCIVIAGRFGFLADNMDGGLKVLDLSDLQAPRLDQKILLRGYCDRLCLANDLLLAAYRHFGTRLFRLSPPPADLLLQPRTSASLALLCTTFRPNLHSRDAITLPGNLMAVACDTYGVELYSLASPQLPVLLDEARYCQPEASAMACAWHKGFLYVASWEAGLKIFRISSSLSGLETKYPGDQ